MVAREIVTMPDNFIASVASDLVAGLISDLLQALGGPSIEKIRDQMFWNRLMTNMVQKLCAGYERLESVEGRAFVIDERFFRDPIVKMMFTEHIIVGDVDRDQLRNRFIALYGESQVALFDHNLNDALAIFQKELDEALDPAERAAFAELRRQLEQQTKSLDESLKRNTQAILTSQSQTDRLVIESRNQLTESFSRLLDTTVIDAKLASEYQAQLDHARDLLQAFQPKLALEYLHSLKERIWDKASSDDRFRLLSYTGFAHLQLNKEPEAAQLFIDALSFNPDSARALCNASLGFLLRRDNKRCEEFAQQALVKDPTSTQAYSMLVQAADENEPFESVTAKVPETYRNTTEVAMALGQLARRRELLPDAEHWFRIAVQADTQDHPDPRGMLADVLLTNLLKSSPDLQMPGIVNPQAALTAEVIELYNFAWEHVARTEIRSFRSNWLINRATVKAWLGETDSAIQDVDEALRDDPKNPYIIRHRAMLAYRTGDLPKAAALFRQILEEIPEAKFWLSAVLFESNKPNESGALIQEFLEQPGLMPSIRRDATRLLVFVKLKGGDLQGARAAADSIRQDFPDDPGVLALRARVARYEGQTKEADAFLVQAQTNLASDANWVIRDRIAQELYENSKFEEAASLLEQIVDTEVDGEATRQLINCYYRSGKLQPALEICRTLREKYGPLRFVTEVESAIYEEIDDLLSAKRVCQEYLGLYPNDWSVQLRLAVVNYRLNEFEDLDRFLDRDLDLCQLTFEGSAQLAHLCVVRNRRRQALEVAYEVRRRFFDKPEAHALYVEVFFRRGSEQDNWLDVHQVSVDTAVCIDSAMGGRRQWIIIEDRDDASIKHGELRPSHPLVKELMNRQVEDSISLSQGAYQEEIIIKEIKSKFVHAFHEVLEAYQIEFPATSGIRRIPVQFSVGDSDSVMKGLQPIFNMIDRRSKYINEAERLYQNGKLPIGVLATILGENPIKVHAALKAKPDLSVHCWSGRSDETTEAVTLLDSNPKLVVDIISLMTLHQLSIGTPIVQTFGKLGVVRATLELVEELLRGGLLPAEGYWTLGKEGEQYTRYFVTKEQIEHDKQVLEDVLTWARANCDILPCTAALAIERRTREKLGSLIGPPFVETVLVATSDDRVLYSDDRSLRELAKTGYRVAGVWTQAVLMNLLKRRVVSEDIYNQCVVRLACSHYRHTSINDQVLLEATKQAKWRPTYPFSQVAQVLSGANSDPKSAVKVAADYVRLLWQQKLLPDQYERLVIAVLDAIVSGRCQGSGHRRQF
jgi:tetratricopeptide (TPR) repeat protein